MLTARQFERIFSQEWNDFCATALPPAADFSHYDLWRASTTDYLTEQMRLEDFRRECAIDNREPVIDLLAGELL